jgi:hypothetical protein
MRRLITDGQVAMYYFVIPRQLKVVLLTDPSSAICNADRVQTLIFELRVAFLQFTIEMKY